MTHAQHWQQQGGWQQAHLPQIRPPHRGGLRYLHLVAALLALATTVLAVGAMFVDYHEVIVDRGSEYEATITTTLWGHSMSPAEDGGGEWAAKQGIVYAVLGTGLLAGAVLSLAAMGRRASARLCGAARLIVVAFGVAFASNVAMMLVRIIADFGIETEDYDVGIEIGFWLLMAAGVAALLATLFSLITAAGRTSGHQAARR